jgi:hypothetical protein
MLHQQSKNLQINYCIRGHELIPENIYIRKNGHSYCLACRRTGNTKYGFEDNICRECKLPKPPVMPGNGTICKECNKKLVAWRKSQPEAKNRISARGAERRKIVINHYGGKCTCCGESRYIFLQIDHIDNDGALHRKLIKNVGLTRWVFAQWRKTGIWTDGLQVLCANCNYAKSQSPVKKCPCQDENSAIDRASSPDSVITRFK